MKLTLHLGVTILVATPGRLLDHLKHTYTFSLERLLWLVVDEADLYVLLLCWSSCS